MKFFATKRPAPRIHAGEDLQASVAAVRLHGVRSHALETGRTRLVATAATFFLAFAVVGVRMVDVAVLDHAGGKTKSAPQARSDQIDIERADILDRNGVILATSLPTVSLYAKIHEIADPQEAAAKLVSVLPEMDKAEVVSRLSSDRQFVYLRRNLTPRQQYDVNALGIPGLYFEKGERRVYPHGNLVAHIVGMTDVDNKGIAGIEKRFDSALRTSRQPLRMSLDVRLQTVVRNEVEQAVAEFSAIGGVGIVMDVNTAEVLAMVSLPDFDPNDPPPSSDTRMFNRATKGLYEMGSTFKLFNTAAALDFGSATINSSYDARGAFHFHDAVIHDYHPENRWLTVPEILIHSSNIGAAKMALEMGTPTQRAFLTKVGLLAPIPIELPEVGVPQIPNPWREINTATIAYGHGISVTPLHLVTGVSALVNGGEYRPPTLLARLPGEAIPGERIEKKKTSDDMRQLMRMVVTSGTGAKADVPGYLVGGKTGTAEKSVNGSYRKKAVLSSFIAAFPVNDPRYCVLVMVDEPQGTKESHGFITGGWVAAPAVARIIAQIAPLVGLQPQKELPAPAAKGIVKGTGSREVAAVE
ncbi:MAG: penicillin-binding protein 2 [Magnetospirillum sp.]|nr:penicillin-binding protein 2 [Magnetospirillum sp.]